MATLSVNSARKIPRGYVVLDETTSVSIEAVTRAYDAIAQPHQRIIGGIQAIPMVPRLPVSLLLESPTLPAVSPHLHSPLLTDSLPQGAKFDKEAIKAIDAEIRRKPSVNEVTTYTSDHERYLSYMRAIEETLLRMVGIHDTRIPRLC